MTWTCPQCGTVNESVSSACVVCGRVRSPSAATRGATDDTLAATAMMPAANASTAATPAVRWCPSCGSAVAADARFCGHCGADQLVVGSAATATAATAAYAAHAPHVTVAPEPFPVVAPTALPPPDELYPPRRSAGRTIAAVLGVIFVAAVAGVGAFLLASKSSNNSATPGTSNDPTSGNLNTGTSSSTSSSTTSTVSTTTTAAPRTTTTAAGATTVPGAAGPLAPPGATKEDLAALDLAQQLANALASKDAAALAKLEPGKTPGGYDDLQASTAILKSSTQTSPGIYSLRLGLVAHERTTDDHSHVYCVTWVVDLAAGHVTETGTGSTASPQYPGWVDPASMVDYVRTSC